MIPLTFCRVVEHTVTLLNILVSQNQGADYVMTKDSNIKYLLEILYKEVKNFL